MPSYKTTLSSCLILLSIVACGKQKEVEKERDRAQQRNSRLELENAKLLKAFESLQTTRQYYWIKMPSVLVSGENETPYENAVRSCQAVSYELPTQEQLAEYFAQYLPNAGDREKSTYFVAGKPVDTMGIALCVAERPQQPE